MALIKRTVFFLIASMVVAMTPALRSSADDKPAAPEDKPAKATKKDGEATEKPAEPSFLKKLGDELLKDVDDTPGADPKKKDDNTEKMDRAVKGMRTAGSKLDEGVTSDVTQSVQKQVIKDLEDIINRLENPPPNQGGGGGGGGGGGASGGGGSSSRGSSGGMSRRGGSGSQQRLRRPRSGGAGAASAQQRPQGSANSKEQAGGQTSENAQDSSKQLQAQRKAAEEAERRRKLDMDVWGHLPAHLREELLNSFGDRMLPKYEQMVKQFYEALSTQSEPKR